MSKKYAIIGTGAIGGFYGGKLAKKGHDVHFLAKSDYEHIKNKGLTIHSINGDFHLEKVNVYNDISNMPPCDVICICLKTTNNHLLPSFISKIAHDKSTIVLIQNGLGMEQELSVLFPELKIAGGMAYICSSKSQPGLVYHQDNGQISFGTFNFDDISILEEIAEDFVSSGVSAKVEKNLGAARWRKLIWNIPYNGLSVVLDSSTDKLMNNSASRSIVKELMLETIEGAQACGYALNPELADQMLEFTDRMRPYYPSMKLDYDNHRVMEIKYIYSNPVSLAKKSGYKMRKVEMLENQLKFLQDQ
ncbi:MAG: putative 2-dehydropantoate 2-reductase [Bacteroidota bacterium]